MGSLLSFACFAYARQQQIPQQQIPQQQIPQQQIPQQQIPQQQIPQQQIPGDVYESGANAGTPAQAVQKLYELAAKMIGDPSSGYDAKTDHWPDADAAWQQWDNSMGAEGNTLTQQQRQVLTACAAHLGAAIDAAERSYRIQISQQDNSAAQADAQKLLGIARTDFEQCSPADAMNGSNDTPASGNNNPGSPSNPLKAGVSTGPDGTPGTTGGGGPGTPQATGTQPASPASPSSAPGSSSQPDPPASIQPTQDFRNKLLADAQTLLRNAGDISKAMSDRMNPATHNNVGVQVGLLSLAGAAGSMMGFAAKEFQLLAAASRIAEPASTYLQIADTAASESGTFANQIANAETQLGSAGSGAVGAAAQNLPGYLEDMVPYAGEGPVLSQGPFPLCSLLSCHRLAQALGRNVDFTKALESVRVIIKPLIFSKTNPGEVIGAPGGLNAAEIQNGLERMGIKNQIESGLENMTKEVGAGNPVIAGVFPTGNRAGDMHALVIEALEMRGKVQGLKIYDPMGWVYWQPTDTFAKYFSDIFIKPL
jgi:hypothetical protein